MNWIDLLLIAVVIIALWSGWQRGFMSGMVALLVWAGSFVAGFLLYPFLVSLLGSVGVSFGAWTKAVSFLITLILARIFLAWVGRLILDQTDEAVHRHVLNKTAGLLPGFMNGLLQIMVFAALLLTVPFPNRVSDAARESRLANAVAPPAFWLMRELAPIFSEPLRNTKPKTTANPHESVTLPYKVAKPSLRTQLEDAMLQLVNQERAQRGLKPVRADTAMQRVARAHSKDMFARGYFAHVNPDGADPFDRMRAMNVSFLTAGENLALAQTLEQAHDGLMNSPGHRANILQPRFGRLGIGILDGGIYGLMVTQNFRN